MIDAYVRRVGGWVPGPAGRRDDLCRELRTHLEEAERRGELAEALGRLGSPREAARTFSEGSRLAPAPLSLRIPAAVADVLPFGALLMAAYWHPDWPGPDFLLGTRWILIALAIAWWNVVLPLAEWRTGRTPGKVLFGLRVVSEDGTALGAGQAFLRRVPTFVGFPLLAVDVPMAFRDEQRRRAFDRVAGTLVVADPKEGEELASARPRAFVANLLLFVFASLSLIELWAGLQSSLPGDHPFWPAVPILVWGFVLAGHAWRSIRGRAPDRKRVGASG